MEKENITINSVYSLSVFKNLLSDPLVSSLLKMYSETDMEKMATYCGTVYSSLLNSGKDTIADYIFDALTSDCNPLSFTLCSQDKGNVSSMCLVRASTEYSMLRTLSSITKKTCAYSDQFSNEFLALLPTFESGKFPPLSELMDSYKKSGYGVFSKSVAYLWNFASKSLDPVTTINPIKLAQLKNYTEEKDELIENTLSFINGTGGLNALLYGDRGTGKSSSISALLNEYSDLGLRIIELSKQSIPDLPLITRQIENLKFKFIIFIDDLSFKSGSDDYAMLKATLEGSVNKPSNILIYATSNRRHLITESHSERNDDIHNGDTMQEQLSLADRFGLVITFLSTDKDEYLSILAQILDDHDYKYDIAELTRLAEKEAIRKGGRSPRLASQLASLLLSRKQK